MKVLIVMITNNSTFASANRDHAAYGCLIEHYSSLKEAGADITIAINNTECLIWEMRSWDQFRQPHRGMKLSVESEAQTYASNIVSLEDICETSFDIVFYPGSTISEVRKQTSPISNDSNVVDLF